MPAQLETAVDRIRHLGVAHANTFDLAAVALARRESDVAASEKSAREVLANLGSLRGLLEMDMETLRTCTGFEPFEALRCQALLELGRRSAGAGKGQRPTIDHAKDVAEMFDHLRGEKREHFCSVLVDAKQQVLGTRTVHIGTLEMSIVGIREVFREAIREGASGVIVVHNHPSGDPTPSPEDLDVTDRLADAGKLLDIPLIDHVILGDPGFVSLRERGAIR